MYGTPTRLRLVTLSCKPLVRWIKTLIFPEFYIESIPTFALANQDPEANELSDRIW